MLQNPLVTYSIMPPFDRVINDSIHESISLPAYCFNIIDTPEFQRLRDIKQLSTGVFAFPCATHTRFEHSIGTAFLSRQWAQKLAIGNPNLYDGETYHQISLITVAGLVHDLGHACFSHSFENLFLKRIRPDLHWSHEDASIKLFEHMVDKYQLTFYDELEYNKEARQQIQSIINGDSYTDNGRISSGVHWTREIVANKQNGIDVDKFDYLLRDSRALGLSGTAFSTSRLLETSTVINNRIAFHQKVQLDIHNLFTTRFRLFRQAYSHRVPKAVELMICDAFVSADPVLGISAAVEDPEDFCRLTDSLLYTIEFSKDPALEEARTIVNNIRRRNLYPFVCDSLITNLQMPKLQAIDVSTHSDGKLTENDVIVSDFKLTYAPDGDNPFNHVMFTDREGVDMKTIPLETVTKMGPLSFYERHIQLFVKEAANVDAAGFALQKLLRSYGEKFVFEPRRSDPIRSSKPSSSDMGVGSPPSMHAGSRAMENYILRASQSPPKKKVKKVKQAPVVLTGSNLFP
ncbi:hypothetical protein GEMRC1_006875 [Eukaryota sp. GEM-RC1]